MPTTPSAPARGAPSWLLVALMFIVLAGVFGMHGFGWQGVSTADYRAVGHIGSVAIGHRQMATPVGVAEKASATVQVVSRAADGAGMSHGELCVAVLSTLGFLLLLLQAFHRRGGVPPQLSPRWLVRNVRGRDRDPPSLARLSVLRR